MTRDASEIVAEAWLSFDRWLLRNPWTANLDAVTQTEAYAAFAAAIEKDRAETIEQCATIADEREESWGAASIRHEAAAIAKAIRALPSPPSEER